MARSIRPLALALIRRGDDILVEEGRDDVEDRTFFRLLGGGIEFGERAADALARELREELGVAVDVGRRLGTLENIFTYEGEPGHELALVYEGSLRDRRLHERDEWEVTEETGAGSRPHRFVWRPVASFTSGAEILYPDGAVDLLADG